jgi:hypothetical protein
MSAEAYTAVVRHAHGNDAQKWMLAILANSASHDGFVQISVLELAKQTGKTERQTSENLRLLRESGQLVVIQTGGGRGNKNVYLMNLPGLVEELPETLKKLVEDAGVNPAESRNGAGAASLNGSNGSSNEKKKSSSEMEAELDQELRDAEVPDEVRADAGALLQQKRKVGGKLVTPREMACAAAALAAFNREFEWKDRKGAEFGLGSALTSIVMRVRERSTWDPARHVRLVESAWRIRWWETTGSSRRPQPNVIWGERAFEQVVQDAGEEAEGKTQKVRYGRGARESARH